MAAGRVLDGLRHSIVRLIGPSPEDRAAGFELALSTQRFARRTKEVVDDKLSFSATLMRAGEVEAANRLLAEVKDEVLEEEAALLERVAEVKVARSLERKPATRLRLARAMAVAMLGSTILASSAVGMAVVGLFREENAPTFERPPGTDVRRDAQPERRDLRITRLNVAGVDIRMTPSELKRYRILTRNGVNDQEGLESFLLGLLPGPAAEKVHMALVMASEYLPAPIKEELAATSNALNETRKKATGDKPKAEAEQSDSPSDEQSPEPSPEDDEDGKKGDEEGDSQDPPIIGDGDGA